MLAVAGCGWLCCDLRLGDTCEVEACAAGPPGDDLACCARTCRGVVLSTRRERGDAITRGVMGLTGLALTT